jgi:hypothetical protein
MAQQMKVGKHKTRIVRDNGVTSCYYHNTRVASIDHLTGKITLNSGGYMTNTTKTRINQFLAEYCGLANTKVYQKDYNWYVTQTVRGHTGTRDFSDGMVIDRFGLFELEASNA